MRYRKESFWKSYKTTYTLFNQIRPLCSEGLSQHHNIQFIYKIADFRNGRDSYCDFPSYDALLPGKWLATFTLNSSSAMMMGGVCSSETLKPDTRDARTKITLWIIFIISGPCSLKQSKVASLRTSFQILTPPPFFTCLRRISLLCGTLSFHLSWIYQPVACSWRWKVDFLYPVKSTGWKLNLRSDRDIISMVLKWRMVVGLRKVYWFCSGSFCTV